LTKLGYIRKFLPKRSHKIDPSSSPRTARPDSFPNDFFSACSLNKCRHRHILLTYMSCLFTSTLGSNPNLRYCILLFKNIFVANAFISLFNTQTMHIILFFTQQHCYVSLKTLYPGRIRTWVFSFVRRMRCPLRYAARGYSNLLCMFEESNHHTPKDNQKICR
jgi:hypothetical protein